MKYKESILDLIGNTPLIKLNRICEGLPPLILAKLESRNPGGSIKDRIGIFMIEDAEAGGLLKKGGTVIEATSGNTGIGIALAAMRKGYKCVFVITDKVSREKMGLLRAFGAEVIVVSGSYSIEDPRHYINVARQIHNEMPNSLYIDQYSNPANSRAHYKTTGPEIWEATEGKITHFVAGIGTGGTITGTGKFLKEMNPAIQVIGVEPEGSVFNHFKQTGLVIRGAPYLVEGIGQYFVPRVAEFQYIDSIVQVNDHQSFYASRKLAETEGILCGGSTGSIVHTVIEFSKKLKPEHVLVFIVSDSAERYLSKVYKND